MIMATLVVSQLQAIYKWSHPSYSIYYTHRGYLLQPSPPTTWDNHPHHQVRPTSRHLNAMLQQMLLHSAINTNFQGGYSLPTFQLDFGNHGKKHNQLYNAGPVLKPKPGFLKLGRPQLPEVKHFIHILCSSPNLTRQQWLQAAIVNNSWVWWSRKNS